MKSITSSLRNTCLRVRFAEGVTKIYDVRPLSDRWEAFAALRASVELFSGVRVDAGGYAVLWNDDLDLPVTNCMSTAKHTFIDKYVLAIS